MKKPVPNITLTPNDGLSAPHSLQSLLAAMTSEVSKTTVGKSIANSLGIVAVRGKEANYQAAARQAYIGLGAALITTAFEEVNATPMEGFDPEAVDEILGLKSKNLRSVVILPLGYRTTEGDWLVRLKKLRRSRDSFVTEIK